MDDVIFIVNTRTGAIEFAGEMPASYNNEFSLEGLSQDTLKDLSWAGHPDMAILNERDVRALKSVRQGSVDTALRHAWTNKWASLEWERRSLIDNQRWRIDRYNDAVALGDEPPEDVLPVRRYIQAIRDITKTSPNPYDIDWPELP